MSHVNYDHQFNNLYQQEYGTRNNINKNIEEEIFTFRDLEKEYQNLMGEKSNFQYVGNASLYDSKYFDILIKLKEQNNLLNMKVKELTDQNYYLNKNYNEKENIIKNISDQNS
jgi:chaperonin cofactor prefoldin